MKFPKINNHLLIFKNHESDEHWNQRNITFNTSMHEIKIRQHIRCHSRFLGVLPTKYQSEDSNALAIIYFSLASLQLLDAVHAQFTPKERSSFIDYIYRHLIETEKYAGFRGSFTHAGTSSSIELAATCFAIQSLLILNDDLQRLPRTKIISTVAACQRPDGGFASTINGLSSADLRYAMIASTICKILRAVTSGIDVNSCTKYILARQNYDGGFGMQVGDESHAGMSFCAVTALSIMHEGNLRDVIDEGNRDGRYGDGILGFLAHRQLGLADIMWKDDDDDDDDEDDEDDIGGFNGRLNKYADTCYVFWTLGALDILDIVSIVDSEAAINFLANKTQNTFMGGFNKTTDPDEMPDPLHSFLGLAALSILNHPQVGKLNTQLVIPESTYQHWLSLDI